MQNRYNLADRAAEDVLDLLRGARASASCRGAPLATGRLPSRAARCDRSPRRAGATPAQVAIAWLLRRSPVMLPIPGTSTVAHLEENVAAGDLELPDALVEELSAAT